MGAKRCAVRCFLLGQYLVDATVEFKSTLGEGTALKVTLKGDFQPRLFLDEEGT